jgi:ATP-dependent helicase HrpA
MDGAQRYTAWTFGEMPELLEIRQRGQTLIGFPALVDQGDAVAIVVFDDPAVAAAKHRVGLRRLFALQVRDELKYLEKNIPELQKMAVAYMPLGTLEELRTQITDVALERAFLLEPLPTTETAFRQRLDEGRGRLTLIANEVARLALNILQEYAAATRKVKDSKNATDAVADIQQQLQRLCPKRFIADTPWTQLQHLPRYLKAIVLRLDKWRAIPAPDATIMSQLQPLLQQWQRRLQAQQGTPDERLEDFQWLLQELRVSLFAQELKTPVIVSVKRLQKVLESLNG